MNITLCNSDQTKTLIMDVSLCNSDQTETQSCISPYVTLIRLSHGSPYVTLIRLRL